MARVGARLAGPDREDLIEQENAMLGPRHE